MVALADYFHDPEGPEPLPDLGAPDPVAFIRKIVRDVLDEHTLAAARAAGLPQEWLAILVPASQD